MQTVIDICGDELEVERFGSNVIFRPTTDSVSSWDFDLDGLDDLADAILAEAPDTSPTRSTVSAKELSFNEGVMRLAAIHGKTVEFRYVKGTGHSPETRRLVPTSVVGQDGNVRFTGHDPDRNAPRQFRLDRIRGDVGVIA